jgi:hypothetical protein
MSKDTVTTECETTFLAQFEYIDDATDEQVEEFATAWCDEVNEGGGATYRIDLRWYEDYANNDTCARRASSRAIGTTSPGMCRTSSNVRGTRWIGVTPCALAGAAARPFRRRLLTTGGSPSTS